MCRLYRIGTTLRTELTKLYLIQRLPVLLTQIAKAQYNNNIQDDDILVLLSPGGQNAICLAIYKSITLISKISLILTI